MARVVPVGAAAGEGAHHTSGDLAERVIVAHEAARLGTWEPSVVTGHVVVDERVAAVFGVAEGAVAITTEAFNARRGR